MKLDVMFSCGNAPKMERVIDLTAALAARNIKDVKVHVREDFAWHEVGGEEVLSYDTLDKVLPTRPKVTELKIENALSHGNGAMCEGIMKFADGDMLYFASVVKFQNTGKDALVTSIRFYYQVPISKKA